jgi:hypothetical protein
VAASYVVYPEPVDVPRPPGPAVASIEAPSEGKGALIDARA